MAFTGMINPENVVSLIRPSPSGTVKGTPYSTRNPGSFLSNAAFQKIDLSSLSASEKEYLSWGGDVVANSETEQKRLIYGYRGGRRDLTAPATPRKTVDPLSITPAIPQDPPAMPDTADIQSRAESLIANPGVDLELEKLNLKTKRRAAARGFAGSILSNPLGIQTGGFKPQTLLTSGGM